MTQNVIRPSEGNFLRRIWITNWSISLRLIVGFVAAILIPGILTFLLVNDQIDQVDLDNLRAYISDTGINQREDINAHFQNARSELTFVAESDVYARQLENVLRFNANQTSLVRIMSDYFDRQLVATGMFQDVFVLNVDGIVIASSTANPATGEPAFISGTDFFGSPVYNSAQNAQILGDTQRVSIVTGQDGTAIVRIVQLLYGNDGEVIGYIVGTMNNNTLSDLLNYDSSFVISVRAYLATVNGDIISTEENIDAARQSFLNSPIEDALARNTGTELYPVGDDEVIGYYGPVDEFFAYVIETRSDTSFTFALREIFRGELAVLVGGVAITILLALVLAQTITSGLRSLGEDISAIGTGDYDREIKTANRQDEIGDVSRTLVNVRAQFRDMVESLETRVQARVRDLEATQEVSRFAATQRNLQELMDQVVDLIVQRFPKIYHAQIFLLDSDQRYAVLRASTGEAGEQLLARGHRLEVGGVSVVGRVTDEARMIVARDTADSEIHRRNEFLPETQAELAIPLRIGDTVIGALDVQSKLNNSFDQQTTNILQVMADAIAIAIENARLYQESVQRLREVITSNRDDTRRAWREHFNARREQSVVSQTGPNLAGDNNDLRGEAMHTGDAVIGDTTSRDTIPFAVPIVLRNQTLGAVQWELPSSEFNMYKVQLAQELVGRLALSLENARLFQESQRAINRERLVNDIAAQLTGQTNIDAILETAVREVGLALRAPQVSIQMQRGKDSQADEQVIVNGANGNQTD